MKISKDKLKQIVKEELLKEQSDKYLVYQNYNELKDNGFSDEEIMKALLEVSPERMLGLLGMVGDKLGYEFSFEKEY